MDEKNQRPEQTHEGLEEEEVYEALSEMKTQKRSEQVLMGLIVAGVFTASIFAYNIWQRDAVASQYQPSLVGTSAGYTASSSAVGGGGCCGASGSAGAGAGATNTGAEAAALAGSNAGGGCGSGGAGAALGTAESQQLEVQALAYYAETYGDDKVTVKIQSFGCHMECYFYKDGQIVKTLIYRGGQFIEK